jgi:hypothetical protein
VRDCGDEGTQGSPLTPERWQDFLTLELATPVRVVYTRARRTPIQVKRVGSARRGVTSALEVRLHSMFAAAPPPVHRAVASWIRSGNRAPRACAALDDWIAAALDASAEPTRVAEEDARGKHHDLGALARGLLQREFAGDFRPEEGLPAITWGRRGPSRTRNSLRLGSFDANPRLVRIHPVLDQESIPAWFVRFVLFHELLHAVHPPERGDDNRWVHHGPLFRRRERAYVDFERAIAWEKRNLRALIKAARRGTVFVPVPEPAAAIVPVPKRETKRSLLQRLLFPF